MTSGDCSATALPRNDDGSSSEVDLPFPVAFFGEAYDSLWVNNNGNVSFQGPMSMYTPFGLATSSVPIIAPFFADVDTGGSGSDTVRYGYGQTTFEGRPAFCVNWLDVGYYSNHFDKLNSFQLLLVSRADKALGAFDIIFNYDSIEWETGDASGGSEGLGGVSARVGFSAGTGVKGTYTEFAGPGATCSRFVTAARSSTTTSRSETPTRVARAPSTTSPVPTSTGRTSATDPISRTRACSSSRGS